MAENVLVTGASRGIGRSIAARLTRDGCSVRYLSRGVAYNAFLIAVYAGESPGDAAQVLARGRDAYPRAMILPMRAACTLLWE